MSRFSQFCRIAKDEGAPPGRQYVALRRAAEQYAKLTETSFRSIFEELSRQHGVPGPEIWDSRAMARAATLLESARTDFLHQMAEFAEIRRSQKGFGRRQPRREFVVELYRSAALGRARPGSVAERFAAPMVAAQPSLDEHRGPEFPIGTEVRVVLNARNRTPRIGFVRAVIWHYEFSQWLYYLQVEGRPISKRYFAEDLRK